MSNHTPLRVVRRDKLLSQSELAALVGVSDVCISRIETGQRAGSWKTRRRLALALGVPEHVLFPPDGELAAA